MTEPLYNSNNEDKKRVEVVKEIPYNFPFVSRQERERRPWNLDFLRRRSILPTPSPISLASIDIDWVM